MIIAVKGIELAKVPQVTSSKSQGKSKAKPLEKGAEKEKGPGPAYDYDDGSVNDVAIRAHVLRGYERFKVCTEKLMSQDATLVPYAAAYTWFFYIYLIDSRTASVGTSA